MNLIVETDIGHDPDDFFALCYLVAAGVNIKAIVITPGDLDQIAIAKFFCNEVGLDIPIGVSKESDKMSSGSIHHELLKKYGYGLQRNHDGMGCDVINDVYEEDDQFFIIGPATNTKNFLRMSSAMIDRSTMQGGFLPYSLYAPDNRLDKFENLEHVPTFNMTGDKEAVMLLNQCSLDRQFVGKNVCHTVEFSRKSLLHFDKPKSRAAELFMEAAHLYFARHNSKKFHDPTAAVLHLHPEIGVWYQGEPHCQPKKQVTYTTEVLKDISSDIQGYCPGYYSNGWTTISTKQNSHVLADVDRNLLWKHLMEFN